MPVAVGVDNGSKTSAKTAQKTTDEHTVENDHCQCNSVCKDERPLTALTVKKNYPIVFTPVQESSALPFHLPIKILKTHVHKGHKKCPLCLLMRPLPKNNDSIASLPPL